MHHRVRPSTEPRGDEIVVWVAVLERGRRTRDSALVRRAHTELARLGVRISIDGQRYGRSGKIGDE